MDTVRPFETVQVLEYPSLLPSSPPTSPPSPVPRSRLRLTTTLNDSISFTPISSPKTCTATKTFSTSVPPPSIPPAWLWRCHLCGISYSLGTTRRCLNDGHYFCTGITINRATGRKKTHQPCGSTFDYIGWQDYGDWRRREQRLRARTERLQNRRPTTVGGRFSAYLTDLIGSSGKRLSGASMDGSNDDEEDSSSDTELSDYDSSSATSYSSSTLGISLSKKKTTTSSSSTSSTSKKKAQHCEKNCNYPSQCRWGVRNPRPLEKQKKRKARRQDVSSPEEAEEEKAKSIIEVFPAPPAITSENTTTTTTSNITTTLTSEVKTADSTNLAANNVLNTKTPAQPQAHQAHQAHQHQDLTPTTTQSINTAPNPKSTLRSNKNRRRRHTFSAPFSAAYSWLSFSSSSSSTSSTSQFSTSLSLSLSSSSPKSAPARLTHPSVPFLSETQSDGCVDKIYPKVLTGSVNAGEGEQMVWLPVLEFPALVFDGQDGEGNGRYQGIVCGGDGADCHAEGEEDIADVRMHI